jgi:pseudouridine-5'-phosphate glycosidase
LRRLAARRDACRGRRKGSHNRVAVRSVRGSPAGLNELLQLSREVSAALKAARPVVALETSIVGQGLPAPHNLRAARGCEAVIREEGAVPATVGVLDGRIRVGLSDDELTRIAADAIKVRSRDLGPTVAQRAIGATTVAATLRAATMAGIRFLATGGIGGVHRGHPHDQSADLVELALSPVAVFCAGAKIILDLPLTLERLESLSVPVLGYGCDEVPAFYTRRSGCPVSGRVDGPEEAARVLSTVWATDGRGVVVTVPPPVELEGAEELAERAVSELSNVTGGSATPRLLARIAELSGGRSLDVNVDLVVNNARVAAQVAKEFFASRSG